MQLISRGQQLATEKFSYWNNFLLALPKKGSPPPHPSWEFWLISNLHYFFAFLMALRIFVKKNKEKL